MVGTGAPIAVEPVGHRRYGHMLTAAEYLYRATRLMAHGQHRDADDEDGTYAARQCREKCSHIYPFGIR